MALKHLMQLTNLVASDVVVFELRVALYICEDDHVSLSLREGVGLEGGDESGGQESFKPILEL